MTTEGNIEFDLVEEAVEDIRKGRMVVVADDESRENEGDVVMAAEKVMPEHVNFITKEARGLLCVPLTPGRIRELKLPLMVREPTEAMKTAFTVSVDAASCTTGISAFERARTIRLLASPDAGPSDFVRPGHVFPLRAMEGGVLRRPGHTEAAVDLAYAAGLQPAGLICEIMNEDGTMARVPELHEFARKHGLKFITVKDLIAYRMRRDKLVERVGVARLPTRWGQFRLYAYKDKLDGGVHVALVKGSFEEDEAVLVRVHSECLTGDVFGSLRCDCGAQLSRALQAINDEGRGVLLYMRQEGRGIGLENKIRAYELQDTGLDTVEANLALGFPPDARDYGIGAQILADLGIRKMKLITNNPRKFVGLEGYGLEIVARVPIPIEPNEHNGKYLQTKKEKLGHII